jgi:hypothetical protein
MKNVKIYDTAFRTTPCLLQSLNVNNNIVNNNEICPRNKNKKLSYLNHIHILN